MREQIPDYLDTKKSLAKKAKDVYRALILKALVIWEIKKSVKAQLERRPTITLTSAISATVMVIASGGNVAAENFDPYELPSSDTIGNMSYYEIAELLLKRPEIKAQMIEYFQKNLFVVLLTQKPGKFITSDDLVFAGLDHTKTQSLTNEELFLQLSNLLLICPEFDRITESEANLNQLIFHVFESIMTEPEIQKFAQLIIEARNEFLYELPPSDTINEMSYPEIAELLLQKRPEIKAQAIEYFQNLLAELFAKNPGKFITSEELLYAGLKQTKNIDFENDEGFYRRFSQLLLMCAEFDHLTASEENLKQISFHAFESIMTEPEIQKFAQLIIEARNEFLAEIITERDIPLKNTEIDFPVEGIISSDFGVRGNPFNRHKKEDHSGIDIAAQKGNIIRALKSGKVEKIRYDRDGYGWYLDILNSDGTMSRHAHLKEKPFLIIGAPVKKGDIIGYVGSTGRSSGPHLHLEIIKSGQKTDPLLVLIENNPEVFLSKLKEHNIDLSDPAIMETIITRAFEKLNEFYVHQKKKEPQNNLSKSPHSDTAQRQAELAQLRNEQIAAQFRNFQPRMRG